MRRTTKAAGLLAAAMLTAAGARATVPDLPKAEGEPELLAPNGRRGGDVDLNEIRIFFAGGYDGDWIRRSNMRFVRSIHGMNFYKVDGRLYVDRDGDHVIDAGAFYIPKTGLVLADWNCDGKGDQILLGMRSTLKSGAWDELARRIRDEGARPAAR
ncbi:hypothetical protein CFHF_14930 [Caulobacter flavus]|uniref:VCBS repeat-containing protein n=1 Tax=Caulobacter flavus TaxID=1679497 RepID=A0A2N5CRV7_9CAUL|nr:hypothetical protein [Caulobacter flavus]AYV46433.1 hypothetical protein C1707_09245 [Caulobacter flavus]PLR12730.1 hypothetical protein CFHF_14930 [Caulobacter flavus]